MYQLEPLTFTHIETMLLFLALDNGVYVVEIDRRQTQKISILFIRVIHQIFGYIEIKFTLKTVIILHY